MSLAEFQKLALQFTDDIRSLARQELMDELKDRGVFGSRKSKKRVGGKKPCRVPGCGKVSKGPRFDFFCEDHRTLSKKDKDAVKRGEKLSTKRAAKPKKTAKAKKVTKPVAKPAETPTEPAPKNGNGDTAKLVKVDGKQKIAYQGDVLTPKEWSKKLGLNDQAVRHRLRRGATPMEAITVKP